jgi:hypothetical protein
MEVLEVEFLQEDRLPIKVASQAKKESQAVIYSP